MDQPVRPLALTAFRLPAALVLTALGAAACRPPAGAVADDTPFRPGWARHAIDAHVAISAPPALRFVSRPTPEHAGGVLEGDDVVVFLSAGASFVYTRPPSPADAARPRQTVTIAGQPVPVEAWQRQPARITGKPFELAALFESAGIRVSAHAACRSEAACNVAREVLASIEIEP